MVASALGHSSPAVTHAHYIDGDTARRRQTQTRRVIGKVAPDLALRVVGDEAATAVTATTTAPRKLARRGSGMAAEPALRVVRGEPNSAGATAAEPGGPSDYVENGQ